MKKIKKVSALTICCLLFVFKTNAEVIYISSQLEFNNAHDIATASDSIVWRNGIYHDIFMDIDRDHLFIMAENLGEVIFTGSSKVDITSDYITLQGFQYLNGDIGSDDVINTRGSYNLFTQLNIRAYTCYKYLRVRESSQYVEITYCNFENRLNLDDQNILSILVDDTNPGYHKIQHCSFKNFEGTGNDLGIEPIRIGLSSQADHISRCLVEYCYFTNCDGDGELISSKATQNVYRFNTFENNSKAELVLRHGSEAIVYGNFFINGKGGVRVREGQDHYIYNNYFYNLNDRAIYLQNEASDPLDNINIAFNTIVDCAGVRLGKGGNYEPTDVTLSNNIFSTPNERLFEAQTGNETWIANITFGELGIPLPTSGITAIDPILEMNSAGFYGLTENSPALNSAGPGYKPMPNFPGIDDIDYDISFDLMGQNRPNTIGEKDLGCSEFPHDVLIQPLATEDNTGPSYNTTTSTTTQNTSLLDKVIIDLNPNPVSNRLHLTIQCKSKKILKLAIYNMDGRKVDTLPETILSTQYNSITNNIDYLPPGQYNIKVIVHDLQKNIEGFQTINFIKI